MISLKNITLRRGARAVLEAASATIHSGEKVGLVGRNGAGKSTLFALLRGELHEDSGDWSMPAQWQVATVAQDMPETDEPASDFALAGDTRLLALKAQLQSAEAAGDGVAIGQAHADLADAGVHDALPRAQALLLGLGFKPDELTRPVNSFSGGWRMRLQLARALMCPSDLLLLDEPTNHLDLDALVWLESWLRRYAGTLIVISHDREFLDAVTGVTLHIEHAILTRYGSNYSGFETLRAQQLALRQASYARQQEKIAHLQKFIDRFKAKATKARQAQSRVKALERMERIAPVLAEAEFSFEFREPPALPNPMLALRDGVMGYRHEAEAVEILRGVDRTVLAGQRIGILGANGQGKSTLVKTIARVMPALSGKLTEGKGLRIGYFAQQELDVLRPDETPLAHMVRLARDLGADAQDASREQDLRNYLGSFNFSGDMVMQPVGTMSGGEKARLVLAMIVWQRPNLLLLDEPTNHLDLATREALSVALNEFEGTVMLVSHDRALLRSVCDEFWLVARGRVQPFDGDLDDYQQYLLDEARRLRETALASSKSVTPPGADAPTASAPAAPAGASTAATNPQAQRRADAQQRQQLAARTRPVQREIEQVERTMAALESERQALEDKLLTPLPPPELADCGRRLKAIADETSAAEERWLELSEQLEAMRSGAV
ncbi:MAG: ATP-binding cassette domain-containing protein [Betaproteobacteria bacterium]|nr:ATP-binding cassette domain-containing protein [Betaproteobacteria bacterium]